MCVAGEGTRLAVQPVQTPRNKTPSSKTGANDTIAKGTGAERVYGVTMIYSTAFMYEYRLAFGAFESHARYACGTYCTT